MKNKQLPKTYPPHNSSLRNFSANWLAAGIYLITFVLGSGRIFQFSLYYVAWILPVVIFLLERNSGLTRFHAAQAAMLYFFVAIMYFVADLIGGYGSYALFIRMPSLKRTLSGLVFRAPALIAAAYGSYLSIRAAIKWSEYQLPLIGGLASWLNSRR